MIRTKAGLTRASETDCAASMRASRNGVRAGRADWSLSSVRRPILSCHRPLQAGDPVITGYADDPLARHRIEISPHDGDYQMPRLKRAMTAEGGTSTEDRL